MKMNTNDSVNRSRVLITGNYCIDVIGTNIYVALV